MAPNDRAGKGEMVAAVSAVASSQQLPATAAAMVWSEQTNHRASLHCRCDRGDAMRIVDAPRQSRSR